MIWIGILLTHSREKLVPACLITERGSELGAKGLGILQEVDRPISLPNWPLVD